MNSLTHAQNTLLETLADETIIVAFDIDEQLIEYLESGSKTLADPFVIDEDFKALAKAGYIEMTQCQMATGMKKFIITEAGETALNETDEETAHDFNNPQADSEISKDQVQQEITDVYDRLFDLVYKTTGKESATRNFKGYSKNQRKAVEDLVEMLKLAKQKAVSIGVSLNQS